ncbi:hypothetical protein DFP73DRAFT_593702 [Morchella snyderi]|nr:hypothetical protein DFP73DRAFT_593702 [Morchella snyderi]
MSTSQHRHLDPQTEESLRVSTKMHRNAWRRIPLEGFDMDSHHSLAWRGYTSTATATVSPATATATATATAAATHRVSPSNSTKAPSPRCINPPAPDELREAREQPYQCFESLTPRMEEVTGLAWIRDQQTMQEKNRLPTRKRLSRARFPFKYAPDTHCAALASQRSHGKGRAEEVRRVAAAGKRDFGRWQPSGAKPASAWHPLLAILLALIALANNNSSNIATNISSNISSITTTSPPP